ncbi:MAG: NADAR family protein [Pyrinomonadaceae bacterium]
MKYFLSAAFLFALILGGCKFDLPLSNQSKIGSRYPSVWFAPINDPNKPDWEILPQEAKVGEVILSKRNELGILSNFAATPFEMDGKRYASVEGFWQMMLYPEGPDDERARDKRVTWKYTREQVAQMTGFEAKSAGTLAEENMKALGIDWVTYNGKRFPYRSATPGEHYRLILAAMRAKADQNPEVKRILLATGDLILKPDHHGENNPPPEWKYYEIWMQIRSDIQKTK